MQDRKPADLNGYLHQRRQSMARSYHRSHSPQRSVHGHLMEDACPLHIEVSRGRANIQTVMKDILALTKLNYNACIYGDGLPVTLRFSDKIGDILTAIPEVNWAAKPFKYYI